jgi:hypothetical protein
MAVAVPKVAEVLIIVEDPSVHKAGPGYMSDKAAKRLAQRLDDAQFRQFILGLEEAQRDGS